MAEDARADDFTDQLRESFADRIRCVVRDLPAHQALQLADALCAVQLDVLAGLRVAYKAKRQIDGEAVAEDWRRGMSLAEITAKHRISRSAAYKHHPNKLARRARAG